MSQFVPIVLVVVGIWLGVLTLVIILTIRQIALLTVRLSMVNTVPDAPVFTDDTFSLADDGPDVGSSIPEEVVSLLPGLPELVEGRAYVLLISATCTSCRKLAAELRGHRFQRPVIALVPGSEELARGLVQLLPAGMHIVRNPEATRVAKSLQIRSTPFAVAIENGTITKKAYMYHAADFVEFVDGKEAPMANGHVRNTKEVAHVS